MLNCFDELQNLLTTNSFRIIHKFLEVVNYIGQFNTLSSKLLNKILLGDFFNFQGMTKFHRLSFLFGRS